MPISIHRRDQAPPLKELPLERLAIKDLVFVDDLTGQIVGEPLALFVDGAAIEFIPADGGPPADALVKSVPPGCHIEIRGGNKTRNRYLF
jgi:hypothetical protein